MVVFGKRALDIDCRVEEDADIHSLAKVQATTRVVVVAADCFDWFDLGEWSRLGQWVNE